MSDKWEVIEWLEREEVPEEARETIKDLKDYLRTQLRIKGTKRLPLKRTQIDALVGAWKSEARLLEQYKIRVVVPKILGTIIPRYLYHPVRYFIPGKPGFWGWQAVQRYLEESD